MGRYLPGPHSTCSLHTGLRCWVSSIHVKGGHLVQTPEDSAEASERYSPTPHFTCFVQVKPFVVPPHLPERYHPAAHIVLLQVVHTPLVVGEEPSRYWLASQNGCMVQLNPFVSPLQLPVLYWSGWHVIELQVVHAPLRLVDASLRNSVVLHVGWSAQVPSAADDWPVKYFPSGHSVCAPQE